jgi:hypothetical protein
MYRVLEGMQLDELYHCHPVKQAETRNITYVKGS